MDNLPDHIYFKDVSSRFVRNNKAHRLSFDLTDPNQMVGKSDFDFFTKEVAQRQYDDEQKIIRTGQPINKEEFTVRNDGSINWYYSTKMPLRNKEGKIIGTFGISRDITERKQAENALMKSEEKYRTLIENMGEGIGFMTEEEIIVFANPSAEKIFRVEKGELTGLCLNDFLLGENIEIIKNETQNRRKGKSSVYELEIVLKDGSRKDILVTATPSFDDRKFIGTFGIFRDITERKKMEKALRESEEKYRLLAESSPEMIYMIDKDGYIKYINSVAAAGFQLNKNQLIGKNLTELYPPDVASSHFANIKQVFNTRQSMQHEIEEEFPNGKQWITVHLAPLTNESGEVTAVLGLSNNITDRKRAEEEIKQKNEELAKLNAEKDKFFSIIAHDLRSPFNSLLGFTQLLVDELPTMDKDQIHKSAVTMRKSATKLYNLLENLLEWSLIQRGMISFKPESFILLNGIVPIIDFVRDAANKKTIRIGYDIPEDLRVTADEHMFTSLMSNLIFNAVKFTPKSGNISIVAKPIDSKWVEISVKDTGIGMSKEMIDNLFRLDTDTNRKGTEGEPSTGLGLILCKEFIEKHGGKLWAESKEGKGSTFYFTLPNKARG